MRRHVLTIFAVTLLLAGCAGVETQHEMEGKGTIVFPNGTLVGGASADQAQALAQILVDSHNLQMQEMRAQGEAMSAEMEKNRRTAELALQKIEQVAQDQGSGEITLFFSTGSAQIGRAGEQHQRLVRYLDRVSFESRGRQVHFVMIGSASSTGPQELNERLSRERANAPVKYIDQYLVNVPHDYYKVNGVGDMYSPQDVASQDVHRRYQNVRIIAVYETDRLKDYSLPEES